MWSDLLKILFGWFLGLLAAVYVGNYQACRDSEKLARVLLTEVRHNYKVSGRLAEFGQKFFGAKLKSEMQAGKDPRPKESASKYLRVFHHHAVAIVNLVQTTDLLNILQQRADRGLFRCLKHCS